MNLYDRADGLTGGNLSFGLSEFPTPQAPVSRASYGGCEFQHSGGYNDEKTLACRSYSNPGQSELTEPGASLLNPGLGRYASVATPEPECGKSFVDRPMNSRSQ
ncbi:unnamed protein product, partial [Protopolystoma xenopodis]